MLDHVFVDALIDEIVRTLDAHCICLSGARVEWRGLFEMHRASLKLCESHHELEDRINGIMARSGLSHAAFFSDTPQAVPARLAIAATLRPFDANEPSRWIFQDVHPGGLAHNAGIRPGHILMAVDDTPVRPPIPVTFALGRDSVATVDTGNGKTTEILLSFPKVAETNGTAGTPPMVQPPCVTHMRLDDHTGCLRIAFFPGATGRPFASALTRAVAQLGPCDKLLIDLRGNNGGFVGALRLMSHLTSRRMPIGYSLTKRGQDKGLSREQLMRLSRIPRGPFGDVLMYLRFKHLHKDRSVSLWTEGLGRQPFHGRTVLLVNEHTFSAAEMVAAFAYEEGLATLVGTKTGGQALGGANYRVAERYVLRLPAAVWYTWRGTSYEGVGVPPNVEVSQSMPKLHAGIDTQFETAKEVLTSM